MACAYQLWNQVSMTEYYCISNAAFEGFISNKHTKNVTAQTANAVANEPC